MKISFSRVNDSFMQYIINRREDDNYKPVMEYGYRWMLRDEDTCEETYHNSKSDDKRYIAKKMNSNKACTD